MAFFKFRKAGDESSATRQPPESIEAMRKRARHRLIGAGVLVLAGVIAFPVLFDTQPRPISVDIPIDIPDRDKAKPLPAPAPRAQTPAVSGPVTPAPAPAHAPQAVAPAPQPAPAPVAKVEAPVAPAAEAKPAPKPEPRPEPKTAARSVPEDGAKAKALLEGKPVRAAAAEGRFVVQVGAFADPAKARATRLKVERAGLKTYTHVAETKEGKRVRVRVGPFETRAEADKAASRIKGLQLPAAVLTL